MNDGTIISIFFARIALHGHGSLHWGIYFYMPRFISGARELWSIHIMALSHTHCLFQNPMLWHHDPILSTFWTPAISSLASSEVCWCSDLWKHFNNLSSILALHKCALQDWFCLLNLLTDFTFYNEIFSDRRNRFSLPAINWSYCVKFDPIQHHSTLITSCFWMTPFIPFIFSRERLRAGFFQ